MAASASLVKYALDRAYKLLQLERTPLADCVLPCARHPVYNLSLNNVLWLMQRGLTKSKITHATPHSDFLFRQSSHYIKIKKKKLLCQGLPRACQGNSPKCNPTKERLISRCEMTSFTCMNCCCSARRRAARTIYVMIQVRTD
jgi:hypothetical protein